MSTSPMGANKPIEDIEATLLAATKSALDELVWWAHARGRTWGQLIFQDLFKKEQ
jgi:hypothetical protein